MARDTGFGKPSEGITIRNMFPGYRAFLEGFEITNLVSSVRINWSPGNPQTCTLELLNPSQLMTITDVDMAIIAGFRNNVIQQVLNALQSQGGAQGTNIPSTSPVPSLGTSPNNQNNGIQQNPQTLVTAAASASSGALSFPPYSQGDAPLMPPITSAINNIKTTILVPKLQQIFTYTYGTTGIDQTNLPNETFYKYPMVQGKWIWHFSDRVRVVFQDPVNPTVWYWMHAGTITDTSERENEDLQSVLTITSEGVLKTLRNSRIQNATGNILSPSLTSSSSAPSGSSGQQIGFTPGQLSTLLDSPLSNFLQGMELSAIVDTLIFGGSAASTGIAASITEALSGGQSLAVIAERFGVSPSDVGGSITQSNLTAYIQQNRSVAIAAAGPFKPISNSRATDICVLGSMNAYDAAQGSVNVTLGTSSPSLPSWQARIDHQVKASDVQDMLANQAVLTGTTTNTAGNPVGQAQSLQSTQQAVSLPGGSSLVTQASSQGNLLAQIESVINTICMQPDQYPIEQYARLLLPAQLTSLLQRNVLDLDLASTTGSVSQFYDRLSLLHQITERLEFCVYDTPKGEIIIEMPLYDFEPRHWSNNGQLTTQYSELQQNTSDNPASAPDQAFPELASLSATLSQVNASTIKEASFDLNYRIFPWEQVSIDLTANDQDIKTVWIGTPRFTISLTGDTAQQYGQRQAVQLPNLIPLYGLRVETNLDFGLSTTAQSMDLLLHLSLNKANADTTSARVPCAPNFRAWLNRPVLVDSRSMIGVTKSVTQSIVWQSDCSTEYGFWHFKFWDGRFVTDQNGTRYLYAPFGGVNAQPFNYAYLLGIDNLNQVMSTSQPGSTSAAVITQAISTLQRAPQ
jgi:hypothetical protein